MQASKSLLHKPQSGSFTVVFSLKTNSFVGKAERVDTPCVSHTGEGHGQETGSQEGYS